MTDFDIEEIFPENEEIGQEIEEKTPVGRTIGRFVVRSSVKFVIAGAITTLIPEPENKRDKVRLFVGTYALSGMVAKQAQDFMDTKFDEWKQDIAEIPDTIKKIREEIKKFEEKRQTDADTTDS